MSTPKARKQEKIEIPQEMQLQAKVNIGDLLRKLENDVRKGNVKYHTPYTLASTYNIKMSDARRVLNEAVKQGIMKLYSGGRRSPIYIPAHAKTQ